MLRGAIRTAKPELLDTFLVSAVATVLGIRIYLEATGYPQLGGNGLHIAHVLWGGLGMVVAIGLLLSFQSSGIRLLAAVAGGVGFGSFIDELGKFVTSDNNYFFKPTAAVVYAIFVVLFLAARQIRRFRKLTPDENLVNAIELSKEMAVGRLSPADRDRAIELLNGADPGNPLVAPLRAQFIAVAVEPDRPSRLARVRAATHRRYVAMVGNRWFRRVISGLFVLQALGSVLTVLAASVLIGAVALGATSQQTALESAGGGSSVTTWIELGASLIAGAFVVVGVLRFRHSRIRAYHAFELSVLIDLLLAQPFALLDAEFGGFASVLIDLALLAILRQMQVQERRIQVNALADNLLAATRT